MSASVHPPRLGFSVFIGLAAFSVAAGARVGQTTGAPERARDGLNVVVLLDSSTSVRGLYDAVPVMDALLRRPPGASTPSMAQQIADELGQVMGRDSHLWIGSYGSRVLLPPAPVADSRALPPAVLGVMQPGGPSPLCDATWAGIELLANQPGRRAIVVLSDGLSSGNVKSLTETIAAARRHLVTVHGIELARSGRGAELEPGDRVPLRVLVEGTGGRTLVGARFASRRQPAAATVLGDLIRQLVGAPER